MKKNLQVEARFLSAMIASLFAIVPLSAAAQQGDFGPPVGVQWGSIVAYPEGTMTIKHNDNVFSQPSGPGERSAVITVLAPSLKLEAKDGPHTYDLTASIENGTYSNGDRGTSAGDYTDYRFNANADWIFSGRAGLRLTADYMRDHDDQGSIPGAGFHSKPDKWNQTTFAGLAGYGAEGAQGRLEVDFGLISKEYENFERDSFGNPDNRKRDYDTARLAGTFFWRVMPKTQLLFRVAGADFDYKQKSFGYVGAGGVPTGATWTTLDSTEMTYQVGVTWEATAKTTGIFRIGRTEKDYSKSSLKDWDETSWEAAVKWSPLTYSTVDFTSGQAPSESSIGTASLDTRYGIAWNHAWNSRLSSLVSYNYLESDYQYNSGTLFRQNDKTDTYNLKLDYRWTRVIKVGGFYEYTDRTSNNRFNEYKRNIYGVFLNAAI
ncbi:MAG: hypothetical protein FIA96_07740 [Betaproteobacteria bacterium]|nr:hypothetical protein [Betaproteobacteria bacterium]